MTAEAIRRAFAGKKPPAVVLAAGPETYLREEAMKAAAAAHLGSADSPDVITIQADEGLETAAETAARFLGEARTASLFGGPKVVVLRDADAVAKASKAALISWLQSPAPSVVGVILAGEVPAEVSAACAEKGVVVACGGGRGGDREAPTAFVRRRAADRGKRIGASEADLVVERVGDELAALDNAVEILSLHAGDAQAIAASDVDALFRSAREGTIYEFGDLLAEGEVARAVVEARRCFAEGIQEGWGSDRVTFDERTIALRLVGAFVTSVTRASGLRRQLDAGVSRDQLSFGPPAFKGFLPWKAKERVVRIAARRRHEALDVLLLRAEETERGMKSGGAEGRVAVLRLATAVGLVR